MSDLSYYTEENREEANDLFRYLIRTFDEFNSGVEDHHFGKMENLKSYILDYLDNSEDDREKFKMYKDKLVEILNNNPCMNILEIPALRGLEEYKHKCTYEYILESSKSHLCERLEIPKNWEELQTLRYANKVPFFLTKETLGKMHYDHMMG